MSNTTDDKGVFSFDGDGDGLSLATQVPSKKYKFYGAGGGLLFGAAAAVTASLLADGFQEFLLGLILDNAKELILNSPVVSVIIIAAASAVVAGLIGFAIGCLIDKRPAKADEVEIETSGASRRASTSSNQEQVVPDRSPAAVAVPQPSDSDMEAERESTAGPLRPLIPQPSTFGSGNLYVKVSPSSDIDTLEPNQSTAGQRVSFRQ